MGSLVEAGSKYSDADRRNAVAQYLVLGNVSATARATGIPRRTIGTWTKTDWWVSLEAELRQEIDLEILANNLEIVREAQSAIRDRIEHGDYVLVKGELVRVPVKARDLAVVGGIAHDKVRLQRNQPTSITATSNNMQALLEQFEQLARDSRAKVVSDQ